MMKDIYLRQQFVIVVVPFLLERVLVFYVVGHVRNTGTVNV